jgi:PKD repeat protein
MNRSVWFSLYLSLLVISTASNALQLIDNKSFIYDIDKNGALTQGTLNAYATMYQLRVNGTNYVGDITGLSTQGQEVNTRFFTEPRSGLEIKRRIYVPKMQNFARYFEILKNPTDKAVTVDVEIFGTLGSGKNTVVKAEQQQFLITEDSRGNQPTLLHYHSQVGSSLPATYTLNNGQLRWVYPNLTIPAGGTRRIVYFVAQTANADVANQVAMYIFGNPSALYEGIGEGRSEIPNFTAPTPTPNSDFTQAPFLNSGESRSGFLEESDSLSHQRANTPADLYAIHLSAGQRVAIRMSAFFNAYLYLFADSAGTQVLASNDDQSVDTTNAQLLFTAPQEGNYYLEATAHDQSERGMFTLEINDAPSNQPPQAYPFQVSVDSLTAPTLVTLTDFSTDVDGQITQRCWQFGDGSPRSCSSETTITHTYQQAGHYSISLTVQDDKGAWGHYSQPLSIRAAPEGVVLPVSNTVTGELASSDHYSQTRSNSFADRYRVTSVTAGQELVIDMQSQDFDSYLYLYDEYRRLLRLDDNSGGGQHAHLRYTPVRDGDLYIEATSFEDNKLGNYSLSLRLATADTAVKIPVEAITSLQNPLENLFVARLPESFQPTFLTWNFGDNTASVSTDKAVVSHLFNRSGFFTLQVTATNASGKTASGIQYFSVNNQVIAPLTRFSATPLFGEKPLRVFFSNESLSYLAYFANDTLSYIWQFGDGEISTNTNPTHTFTREGMYQVVLQAYSTVTQQSASFSVPVVVIDRDSANTPVTQIVRLRPQVLIAGFDPMLVDLLDTDVKVFAIVRPGNSPIQTVRVTRNNEDFSLVMQHVATYPNGDQRFEAVYTFPLGDFPVITLANLFGDQTGQFRIQAIDQTGQFHAFPNLEISDSPALTTVPQSLHIEPLREVGIRRSQPQVLGAGYDPALVDASEAQFTVQAIVREGLYPISSVVLQQNKSTFAMPMRLTEILPNGDKFYSATYHYPKGSFDTGTLGNLFGDQPYQFMVMVTDVMQQTHRFPEFKVGNYPAQ